MRRRSFLYGIGAGAALWAAPPALAALPSDDRLVVVLLRGGLDGLAAFPATGDPAFAGARGEAATPDALPLDGTFGMHPALAPLAPRWEAGELLVVHATGIPYRERSHFDAQDALESGSPEPHGARTGWLGRAVAAAGGATAPLAAGRTVPLILRGPMQAASGDPERGADLDPGLLARVQAMYRGDPVLAPALDEGVSVEQLLARHREGGTSGPEVLGRALADEAGPRVAVLELGGFDTHVQQARTLDARLADLADTLEALRRGLGPAWGRTAVVAVTEFGRTVAANGTGGTDHGVGSAAVLLGGAVAGGRVLADWPGLDKSALLDGRDLRPTTDLRAVFAGLLRDHLGLDERALAEALPDPAGPVAPVDGLLRG